MTTATTRTLAETRADESRVLRLAIGASYADAELTLPTSAEGAWTNVLGRFELPADDALDRLAEHAATWTSDPASAPTHIEIYGAPAAALLPIAWLRTSWLGPEVPVTLHWERVEPELKKGQQVVPYRRWTLSVDVFTSWFIDESDVQFRFRLTGFDEDWRDLQPEAAIRLNTLPPGEYRLEAQAWSRLAGFGPATELLAFRVEKPRWLKRLVTSPISSFVEFRQISRAVDRNRALNRKNLELQQLVEERTADLEQAKARLEVVNLELASQSLTDPLTGIGNRRLFDEQLDAAVLEARRHGSPLSLLLIDVDHFKPYNDLYGHARGDEALVFVARQLLSTLFRPGDQAARYGGEEFAVLLPNADREGAMSVAERLRDAVEGLSIEHEGAPDTGNVTISIGVTTWNPLATTVAPGTGKLLVESADAALYDAKQAGRNRTAFRPLGVNS